MQAPGPEYQQVEVLIRHVRRGTMQRFCGFMKSLKDSNQTRVLDVLEIDHDTYLRRNVTDEEERLLEGWNITFIAMSLSSIFWKFWKLNPHLSVTSQAALITEPEQVLFSNWLCQLLAQQ